MFDSEEETGKAVDGWEISTYSTFLGIIFRFVTAQKADNCKLCVSDSKFVFVLFFAHVKLCDRPSGSLCNEFYRWLQPPTKTSADFNTEAQRTFCFGSTSSLKPRQQLSGIFIRCRAPGAPSPCKELKSALLTEPIRPMLPESITVFSFSWQPPRD